MLDLSQILPIESGRMTPLEMRILRALADSIGNVVPAAELRLAPPNKLAPLSAENLATRISMLRRKLRVHHILSYSGGYMLREGVAPPAPPREPKEVRRREQVERGDGQSLTVTIALVDRQFTQLTNLARANGMSIPAFVGHVIRCRIADDRNEVAAA